MVEDRDNFSLFCFSPARFFTAINCQCTITCIRLSAVCSFNFASYVGFLIGYYCFGCSFLVIIFSLYLIRLSLGGCVCVSCVAYMVRVNRSFFFVFSFSIIFFLNRYLVCSINFVVFRLNNLQNRGVSGLQGQGPTTARTYNSLLIN